MKRDPEAVNPARFCPNDDSGRRALNEHKIDGVLCCQSSCVNDPKNVHAEGLQRDRDRARKKSRSVSKLVVPPFFIPLAPLHNKNKC